ncbi:MAG TPA: hypothetical protein ENN97_10325 [Phycisphaerales bacterium]|nr:hypothetical protein [Phycisphaerales bacterium]
MKPSRLYISILIGGIIAISGCVQEQPPASPVALEGIRVADIMPTIGQESLPVISFLMTTYLVDEKGAKVVRGCLDDLAVQPIRFRSEEAFEKNGLFASMGVGLQIHPLVECFRRPGIRQREQGRLAMNPGYELSFGAVSVLESQEVTSFEADGSETKTVLSNGRLSWSLSARRDSAVSGRIAAMFEPVFTPWAVEQWSKLDDLSLKMTRRFEAGRFGALLRMGDFIALGPRHNSIDEFTDIERLLFVSPEEPDKFRIYIILCVDAETG